MDAEALRARLLGPMDLRFGERQLPPLQAEVIMLRVVAGLDTEAVAQLVGRSPGAVRVAVHRGLRRLAQMMTEAGVTR